VASHLHYNESMQLSCCPWYAQARAASGLSAEPPASSAQRKRQHDRTPKSAPLVLTLPSEVLQLLCQSARFMHPPPVTIRNGNGCFQTVRLSVEVGRVGFMFDSHRRRGRFDTQHPGLSALQSPDDLCVRLGLDLKDAHLYGQYMPTAAASLLLRAAGPSAPQVEWPASWPQQPGPNTVFAGFFEVQNSVLHVLASDALVKKAGATMRLYPKVR
jgi:hypothetical protein